MGLLYRKICIFLAPIFFLVVAMACIDPYGELWRKTELEVHRKAEAFWSDFFYYKWTAYTRLYTSADVIIIGDSRADQLNEFVEIEYRGLRVLNIGVPGYNAKRIQRLYSEIRKSFNGLVLVVWNADNFYRSSSETDIEEYNDNSLLHSKLDPYRKYLQHIVFQGLVPTQRKIENDTIVDFEVELRRYREWDINRHWEIVAFLESVTSEKTRLIEGTIRRDLHDRLCEDLKYYYSNSSFVSEHSTYQLNSAVNKGDFVDCYHLSENTRETIFNTLMEEVCADMLCDK